MARLMNAVGFCSTKWKGLNNERKESIRHRVDGPEYNDNIKEIMTRLHVSYSYILLRNKVTIVTCSHILLANILN